MAVPRGIQNNNPGNLVITNINWQGKVPVSQNTDGKFEQFTSMAYGVRAMLKDLIDDIDNDGNNTIRKLITVYAPPRENDTEAYIKLVSSKTGIPENQPLTIDKNTLLKVGSAITGVENGWSYQLSQAQILDGYNLIASSLVNAYDTVNQNKGSILPILGLIVIGVGGYYYIKK